METVASSQACGGSVQSVWHGGEVLTDADVRLFGGDGGCWGLFALSESWQTRQSCMSEGWSISPSLSTNTSYFGKLHKVLPIQISSELR